MARCHQECGVSSCDILSTCLSVICPLFSRSFLMSPSTERRLLTESLKASSPYDIVFFGEKRNLKQNDKISLLKEISVPHVIV